MAQREPHPNQKDPIETSPPSPPNTTTKPSSMPRPPPKPKSQPTQTKQIRALYDSTTITVYQAYNSAIAGAAVQTQRLTSSPLFNATRTTWIKPSWTWMLYRSGYSYKDANQSHILALRMTHAGFAELLSRARIAGEPREKGEVVVQWDPERSVRIGKLGTGDVRSLQVGIPGSLVERWTTEWIVGIEEVTEKARELKRVLDEDEKQKIKLEELMERGLVPREKVYDFMLDREIRERLGMDASTDAEGEDVVEDQGVTEAEGKGRGRREEKGEGKRDEEEGKGKAEEDNEAV